MAQSYAASVQGAYVRVSRLSSTGTVVTGASSSYVMSAFVRLSMTPEYEAGDEFTQKTAGGGVCVTYKAADTLKRVNVQSMGEGAYSVAYTAPFDVVIGPDQTEDVEFWAPARTSSTVIGANGPVSLRVNCQFEAPGGTFQHIVTQVVNSGSSVSGE